MATLGEAPAYEHEKDVSQEEKGGPPSPALGQVNELKRNLHGRHMQMIAVGGAIGAGLFIGSGSALATGGPGSLVIGYIIVGGMLLCTVQALAELAVLYPVNGAFFIYYCRFLDPSWGFALGWDYAFGWLTILPFEITAAGQVIDYWQPHYNIGIWIAVFLVVLTAIQFFGVRGYGEVEFVLSIIKILACIGFIIFGVIVDCGGIPGDDRGYIGAHYWHDPGAFNNGFHGFCTVFVVAAFAFGGTELTALAAAESSDPKRIIPKATRQVFWRIFFFYVVNLFILGLILPYNYPNLSQADTSHSRYSPFVLAIRAAGVDVLPSIFNAVIVISVISVANSATFGSTRTFQALAEQGMAPKILAYIDKKGRPVSAVVLQIAFGLIAFVNEAKAGGQVFTWLLALSGLSDFFIWGSACLAHIRFRKAWLANGRSLEELPFKAAFGVWGSWIGLILNFVCLIAQFYVAVWPIGASPAAETFFENFIAAPVILVLYLFWKFYSGFSKDPKVNTRGWKFFMRTKEIDIYTGLREEMLEGPHERRRSSIAEEVRSLPRRAWDFLF